VTVSDKPGDTQGDDYTRRLVALQSSWWKRFFRVQAPYRWNLRRLNLGLTLELGCGIGRNLVNLGGNGVGVDHNPASVETARTRGLSAYTPEEFGTTKYCDSNTFDSMLLSHLVEHMTQAEAVTLAGDYIKYVKPGGRLVVITPQEVGFRSDASHVRFADFETNAALCDALGSTVERQFSFPFPRFVGRIFIYNEFVTVAQVQG
jgi:SAM-dependent methyltransferase